MKLCKAAVFVVVGVLLVTTSCYEISARSSKKSRHRAVSLKSTAKAVSVPQKDELLSGQLAHQQSVMAENADHYARKQQLDQQMVALELDRLMQQIEPTSVGIQGFIRDVFNHPLYASDTLPYHLAHIEQLLSLAQEKQSPLFARSVLKLFTQKINGSFHINAHQFHRLLEQFPELLQGIYAQEDQKKFGWQAFKAALKQLFYTSFLEQFSFFQEKPVNFLDELATKTMQLAKQHTSNSDQEKLTGAVKRFIESGFHKLMWSPQDQANAWRSFVGLSRSLEQLHQMGIIAEADELDDLYWSLIHRFSYFLNALGAHLNPTFFEAARADLSEQKLLMFSLEEQEELMETKAQHLARALMGAQAQARAVQLGVR